MKNKKNGRTTHEKGVRILCATVLSATLTVLLCDTPALGAKAESADSEADVENVPIIR